MKKLFISCPMKGRTREAIEESMEVMKQIAESMWGEELEFIQTYIDINPPKDTHEGLWYLGKSIEKMAEADYFIGCCNADVIRGEGEFTGCEVERHAAIGYGIPNKIISCRDFNCFADIWKNTEGE